MAFQRERYRASNRVKWSALLIWSILTFPLTLLSGYLLCLAFRSNAYLLFAVSSLAMLPALGVAFVVVAMGKCRNRWLGALVGLATGLIALLSSYQFDYASNAGFDQIHRLDRLPDYMKERFRTDQLDRFYVRLPAPRGPDGHALQLPFGQASSNWILFLGDALLIVLLPTLVAEVRARRPFSERHGRWLYEHNVTIKRDSARRIAWLLEQDDAEALADAVEMGSHEPLLGWGQLRLYYLPYEPATPVYLSVQFHSGTFSFGFRKSKLADRVLLSPDEGAALAERLKPPGATIATVLEVEPATNEPLSAAASAAIDELPADEVAGVLSGRAFSILVAANFLPLIVGLLIVVGQIVALVMTWSALGMLGRLLMFAGIFGVIVGTLAFAARYADELPIRLQRRWLIAAIRRRPMPLFDPEDADAVWVELVPRKNWGKVMFNNAEEIGFAKIDARRRLLLFEGDRQRWSIPATGIESCELEEFCIGLPEPKERNLFVLAVLKVNRDGQIWEAPLLPARPDGRRPPGKVRRQWARSLRNKIRDGLLQSPAPQPVRTPPRTDVS
jgi:hypothetical protein